MIDYTASRSQIGKDIYNRLTQRKLTEKQKNYIEFHKNRFAELIIILSKFKNQNEVFVLDVAPHFTTDLLCEILGKNATIDSIGWKDAQLLGDALINNHIEFDLNDLHFPERWPKMNQYNIVIAGEIIEHLFVTPIRFFEFFSSVLLPGGMLIIQTPNATSIRKRLKMLLGFNPYELINDHRDGHVREFTAKEIQDLIESAGLKCQSIFFTDYWAERGLLRFVEKIIPSLKRGLMVIARKPD